MRPGLHDSLRKSIMTDIHIANRDDAMLTAHRSRAGAARAIADDMAARVRKSGVDALTDDERDAIAARLAETGSIDLNQGPKLDTSLLGLERTTQIAFRVNAAYHIRADALHD
jgi:hypothetical protein